MTDRIGALLSAFGVLVGTSLLVLAVREYRSGASVFWIGAGAAILLGTVYTLVRDVRRLRAGASA
ncbi:hypothetical protein ACFC0C_07040 [Streptomyces sp. NPDC056178]|uniref:hypothetical protein n=1 Tax=Streptomyces sp. NPDC056178 TaxID=3345735 RepID=UPI0035D76FC8